MKFSLSQLLLAVTSCSLASIAGANLLDNWVLLGELTGNYTRIETCCYWIGIQGAIAGICIALAAVALLGALNRRVGGNVKCDRSARLA